MTTSPNLELPQRSSHPRRSGGGMIIVLLLVVVVLEVLGIFVNPGGDRSPAIPGSRLISAEDHKALALRLEDKNLTAAAAEAWAAYLEEADLRGNDAAKVLIRIGQLKQDAGDYEGAVHEYYLAEKLLDETDDDSAQTIAIRVRECFRKLGQYGELSREMAERATGATTDGLRTGQLVVAEIGPQKITLAEFDRLIHHEIELAVQSQLDLTPEEADAFRQRAYSRFADPQSKALQLQQIVMRRVLADAARNQRLDESPSYRERVMALADSILASTLMHEEISRRASVTPEDVKRFFEANKQQYAEPPTTAIAHILCETEEQAREVIAKAKAGEPFDALAKELSTHEATRDSGGAIPQPVRKDGDVVPVIGRDAELHARIWAADPDDVLNEPVQWSGGWSVVKVVSRSEAKPRVLDEVRDQVEFDTRMARRQEVTQQYIGKLFAKAGVKLYPEAFSAKPAKEDDAEEE